MDSSSGKKGPGDPVKEKFNLSGEGAGLTPRSGERGKLRSIVRSRRYGMMEEGSGGALLWEGNFLGETRGV